MTTLVVITDAPSLGLTVGNIVTDDQAVVAAYPQARLKASAFVAGLLTGNLRRCFVAQDPVTGVPVVPLASDLLTATLGQSIIQSSTGVGLTPTQLFSLLVTYLNTNGYSVSLPSSGGGSSGVTTPVPFYKAYSIGGVDPIIALDFKNGQFWDGTAVAASPSALISGGTVVTGMGLQAALGITATGAHLAAHQLAAKSLVVVTNMASAAGSGDGLISYGSDAPLFRNGTTSNPANALITYKASGGATLATVQGSTIASKPEWTKRARSACALNATNRKVCVGGSGVVVSDANALASPSAVTIGSYAGDFVLGKGGNGGTGTPGYIELILIYPSYLSDSDLQLAAAPRPAIEGASGLVFPPQQYVAPADPLSALKFTKAQPWTSIALAVASAYPATLSSVGGYQAGILFTNSAGAPNGGYEHWIDVNGHQRVRIMSNFNSGDYLGVIGTANVVDGADHVLAATYDGSGTAAGIKFYLDGQPDAATVEPGSATTLTGEITANARAFTIGNQLSGGGATDWSLAFMWPGKIDALQLFNVAKPASFFTAFTPTATVKVPPVDAATVYAYGFNEGAGTTTADASGHSYTGTLSAGTRWV